MDMLSNAEEVRSVVELSAVSGKGKEEAGLNGAAWQSQDPVGAAQRTTRSLVTRRTCWALQVIGSWSCVDKRKQKRFAVSRSSWRLR